MEAPLILCFADLYVVVTHSPALNWEEERDEGPGREIKFRLQTPYVAQKTYTQNSCIHQTY